MANVTVTPTGPHATRFYLTVPQYVSDPPLGNPPYKTISGRVYDRNNNDVPGATVLLFRQSDNFMCATTTSGGLGVYVFNRRLDDSREYYTLAYTLSGGSTQVHGTSDRGMVPS